MIYIKSRQEDESQLLVFSLLALFLRQTDFTWIAVDVLPVVLSAGVYNRVAGMLWPADYIFAYMKKLDQNNLVETLTVKITGRVQGVGFRVSTVRHAHMLGITGWVRNVDDGSVEALLQGPHDQMDRMLSWLHVGPPGARVKEVDSQEAHTGRHFDHFEQI